MISSTPDPGDRQRRPFAGGDSSRKGLATAPPRFPPLHTSPSQVSHGHTSGIPMGSGAGMSSRPDVAFNQLTSMSNEGGGMAGYAPAQMPHTAPANLGYGSVRAGQSQYLSSVLSTATRKQNQRLSSILSVINRAHSDYPAHVRTAWGDESESMADTTDFRAVFERNLQDIHRLLDIAKNINEKADADGDDVPTSLQRESDHMSAKKRRDMPGDVLEQANKRAAASASPVPNGATSPGGVDTSPDKRTLAGRKPVRAIMQELAKRIQSLKTNQAEWEALQAKIASYRHAGQGQKHANEVDMIVQNRKDAKTLFPEVKRKVIAERKVRNEEHRQEVLTKKQMLDVGVQKRKQEALQRKEELAAQNLVKEKDGGSRQQSIQSKWFVLTVVATRVKMCKSFLEDIQSNRAKRLNQRHAAIVIQRGFRTWRRARIMKQRKMAIRVIGRAFHKFYPSWKDERRREASNTIQSFFKEAYDVSKLLKIVKKYRFSVIKAQNHCKAFLMIRQAQLLALKAYWDKLEGTWWSQRLKGSQAELEDKKGKKKKKSKKEDVDKNAIKTSEPIKHKLILENLIERKKQHRKAISEFKTALVSYNEELKKRLFVVKDNGDAAAKAPKQPLFKLLPSPAVMFTMMNLGYAATNTDQQQQQQQAASL
ncbi:hypothetical protein BC831DRAFT_481117 [Entophlyctis helioformis]|nr:hypothetical protein BC831DRAFT_481117 [Entophlyctis helioformis]